MASGANDEAPNPDDVPPNVNDKATSPTMWILT